MRGTREKARCGPGHVAFSDGLGTTLYKATLSLDL